MGIQWQPLVRNPGCWEDSSGHRGVPWTRPDCPCCFKLENSAQWLRTPEFNFKKVLSSGRADDGWCHVQVDRISGMTSTPSPCWYNIRYLGFQHKEQQLTGKRKKREIFASLVFLSIMTFSRAPVGISSQAAMLATNASLIDHSLR